MCSLVSVSLYIAKTELEDRQLEMSASHVENEVTSSLARLFPRPTHKVLLRKLLLFVLVMVVMVVRVLLIMLLPLCFLLSLFFAISFPLVFTERR